MRTIIAVLNKKGENAAPAVITALKSLLLEHPEGYGIASSSKLINEKDLERLQEKSINSSIILGCAFSRILPGDKPPLTKLDKATLAFEGRIYSPIQATSVGKRFTTKTSRGRDTAIESFIRRTEGDFSLLIAEPERIVAGRDPVGVQPLYYGENVALVALASNRKTLWKLGIKETRSFPPGHLALVSREGIKFKPVKTPVFSKPKNTTMQEAVATLQRLLERSVRQRVRDVNEVAVAFSGGLDSSTIAFLAKKCQANVHLIHVSLRDRPETEEAKKAAEELRLPINVYLFREEDVAKVAAKVVELVEEPDPVKAAIGIPFYWTAEKAKEYGLQVLLAGQGADELFGGYQRYVNDFLACGEETVRKNMYDDIARLHESNIERDAKICNFHGVGLRLPFASYRIVEFAISLPLEMKIDKNQNSLRKLVLRKAAENMGLPSFISNKPKKAVQYATGISLALKKTAKKQKTTVSEYVSRLFQESSFNS